ncbi:MAG TPA: hypothetical protein VJN21_10520 [Candidatus Acidoferrales bacterium]|nr:hypothetical protein [Candidatus Acidoferrales bacterium]
MKCSSLFSYYANQPSEAAESPETEGTMYSPEPQESEFDETAAPPGFFTHVRSAYRVFRWVTLAVFVLAILLILHQSPPPQVPFDRDAAARAESKLADAQSAVQQGIPYELQLDRTELNSYLSTNLAIAENSATQAASDPPAAPSSDADPPAAPPSAPAVTSEQEPSIAEVQSSVRDVKVDLVDDLVKAYVVFNFHGKDLSLELDGRLSSFGGYLQFQPVSRQLGSLPLPQSALNSAVERLMSSPENKEKLRLPEGVRSVEVSDGRLIIDYGN